LNPPYALYLNGYIQSTGLDEAVYHSVFVHSALLSHDKPEQVFLGGGGEGMLLHEVLRHRAVRKATMVDIDRELMDFSRTHLKAFHNNSFDDPRARVIADDARSYLERQCTAENRYDVVLLDFNDMYLPNFGDLRSCVYLGGLFSKEFFGVVKRSMRPKGIVVAQVPFLECKVHAALKEHFGVVRMAAVPMVAYAFNVFFVASDDNDPAALTAADVDARIATRFVVPPHEWYSGHVHERIWDLNRALESNGIFPCRSDCVLEDHHGGAVECPKGHINADGV